MMDRLIESAGTEFAKQTIFEYILERFENEAGMPKERAEQLLDALQRNEMAEQRKALLAKRREKKGKDW